MKLISWNCQGAFRKKVDTILLQQPDLLIVQECEHPDLLIFNSSTPKPKDFLWFGDNKHKGLGVFSYGDYKLELLDDHNPEIKIISPISVLGERINFTLFAIWAHNPNDPDGQYVEQVWKAIHQYDHLLNNERIILTGDFNSNTIWDRKNRMANHSAVVDKLALKNIYSAYHRYFNQVQGKEDHPTFFLQRNKNKPYHLDYCFASKDLYDKVTNIQIGSFENWIQHSDHTPIIISFDL